MIQVDKNTQTQTNLAFVRSEVERHRTAYLERRSNFFRKVSELEPEDDLLDLFRTQAVSRLAMAEIIYRWVTRLDEVMATGDLVAIVQTLEALRQQITGQLIYTAKTLDDIWDSTEAEAYADLIGQLHFWHNLLKPLI